LMDTVQQARLIADDCQMNGAVATVEPAKQE
jgi:hypothetical protein